MIYWLCLFYSYFMKLQNFWTNLHRKFSTSPPPNDAAWPAPRPPGSLSASKQTAIQPAWPVTERAGCGSCRCAERATSHSPSAPALPPASAPYAPPRSPPVLPIAPPLSSGWSSRWFSVCWWGWNSGWLRQTLPPPAGGESACRARGGATPDDTPRTCSPSICWIHPSPTGERPPPPNAIPRTVPLVRSCAVSPTPPSCEWASSWRPRPPGTCLSSGSSSDVRRGLPCVKMDVHGFLKIGLVNGG